MGASDESHKSGSIYERVGGRASFVALVDHFYESVARDPVLRPLYPGAELSGARQRLTAFLVQYFGGPRDYEALRGEPRLRLRHLNFAIGNYEAKVWLEHMAAAVTATVADEECVRELLVYFERGAAFLVNNEGLSLGERRFEAPS